MVPDDELLAVKKAVVANEMDLEKVAEDFVKEMSKPIRDLVPEVLNKEDLFSLIGATANSLETTFTYATAVSSGQIYRFHYRSKNINGWSPFSQITYVRAARVPYRPLKPTFSTATATSLTINFN